jgi:uncharacterized damage-inducible protein DinB
MDTDPRYPIGEYEPQPYSPQLFKSWLLDIKFLPSDIEIAIQNLDEPQLNTPYREGGWTIRQVVHHVADSHMNAVTRFRLGLTEDDVTIKPYDEAAWAKMIDYEKVPINTSLTLLHCLHERWVCFLKPLTEEQLQRTVYHPEYKKTFTLWQLLGMYAWHGKHHTAHITTLREQNNW